VRSFLALAIAIAVTGCRYEGTYTCASNDQCRSREAPGVCQLPAGLCSFPDPMCPTTGQRYDDTAGELANECVTPAAPLPIIDAPKP
jgi:hypothetical protein